MLIATFGPTTAWVGKSITFDKEQFILEGHGPVSTVDVMEYGRQGHLIWANDGTRAWVGAKAKGSHASHATPATATAPSTTSKTPGATTGVGSQPSPGKPTYLKRVLVLAIALLVVANVVLVLAIAGAVRGPSKAVDSVAQTAAPQSQASVAPRAPPTTPASSWPAKLAGTWVNKSGSQPAQVAVSEAGGQATIVKTTTDGGNYTFTFAGDTLTASGLDQTVPSVLRRQAPSSEPYVGTYVWVTSAGTMTMMVSFSGKTLAMALTDAPSGKNTTETFTIAEDGATLSWHDSGTGVTTVYTRR